MKVDNDVFDEMMEALKRELPNFHSSKRKARIYAKRFLNGFSDGDREFILKEILHSQNKSIIKTP